MERPPGVPATFDVRTVVYLRRGANPPELSGSSRPPCTTPIWLTLPSCGGAASSLRTRRIAFPEQEAPMGEQVQFEDL